MRLFILLLLTLIVLEANNIWWHSNFDEAHHKAVKSSKKLMVFLIEKDSPHNKNILINTFMNKDYIDSINEEYISVIVTKDQRAAYPIELLYTIDYPSVFFLDNLEIYLCEALRGHGSISPDRLRTHLEECR